MADAGGNPYGDLTTQQIESFTDAFNIWDKAQQGTIPFSDFPALWRSIGQNPTEAELKEIIGITDTGSGHFNLDRFLRICESDNPRYLKDNIRPEQLIESFKTFDKDGKGTITIPQLRYMLQCLGDRLDEAEADEFIAFCDKLDEQKVGFIDYEKLVMELMDRDPKNL
mmetsp:Transcript_61771/g.133869  ORF Transcript_61771/g.133869 Transcript_61771/m.133869 type:complete len:168 (-) Transcript_61771:70-573(-)